ncbi:response regulator [Anaeromyxobacter oryzae]|uniref:Response regulator n=1 Tax=Anaeromyxobacter oryzae TaxID=2918170 RepID=A0ABM7WXL4_9BACT|nr:response regulator [Anaeromyxobacter oryzae]BDG04265.1 response regulator [Anaeromyxobacter oryzae]
MAPEKKRILLLDDSAITLEMEKAVLEDRGYRVAVASNLLEFQAQLDQFQPEVILTDLMMPDISGKDIVRVLKQDFHTEKIPIILFSSKTDEELAPIAEQAGADGFLSKSHGIDRLSDMVDELVDSIIW